MPTVARTLGWALAVAALFFSSAAIAQPADTKSSPRPAKKLIEFGWDEPDTAFMRKHLAEMESTPFDGCVFHARYLKGEGRDAKNSGEFMWENWGSRAFKIEEFRQSIDDLKALKPKRFTQNFLRINVVPVPAELDWFDDHAAIINNCRVAARIAKEGTCAGVLFDIEQYGKPIWQYEKQKDAKTKSWDDYAAECRKRGREVMAAFQERFPGGTIFLTFGYSLPHKQSGGDPAKLPNASYGLLAPFLDGMLDAADGKSRIVDGYELSYAYKDIAKFAPAYKTMAEGVLPFVKADHEKYRNVFSLGFGLWIDQDWRKNGWDEQDFSKNFYTPEQFEKSVRTALETSDEYVWVYSETPRWWSEEGKTVKLPNRYEEAVKKAAGR